MAEWVPPGAVEVVPGGVSPTGAPGSGPRRQITTDTTPDPYAGMTPEQRNRAVSADIGKQAIRTIGPSAAAIGASMLVPEAAPVAWLLRSLAAGAGGAAGDVGAQGATGQPINLGQAATRGVGEMVAQGAGEGLLGMGQGVAQTMYRNALRPGKAIANSATETASRIAGQPVAPDVASVAKQGLLERLPIGRGLTGTGGEKMARLRAPSNAQLDDALQAAGISGHTTPIRALADGITALKDEVRHETRAAAKIAAIDKMWGETLAQYRQPAKTGIGKDVRLSPQELQDQVRTWQDQATSYWKGVEGGKPDELAALNARFDAALATAGRRHLNSIAAPSHIPGKTLGNLIEEANTRLSSLHPLGDAISNAELRMESGTGGPGVPWYMHAGAPAAGALLGTAAHGPEGAAIGGLLGLGVSLGLALEPKPGGDQLIPLRGNAGL